jgi:hypothetical protein
MKLLLATINPNVVNGAEELSLALKIASPPQFGVALTSMQMYLEASGGAGGYVYSVIGLPAGYTMPNTATGEFVGSTTALHTVITATVTDGATNTFTATFAINVPNPLTGVDVTPPNAESDFNYSYQLNIAGATGTVTYALTSGSLPVSLSTSGLLSASPVLGLVYGYGAHTGVITASDSGTGCSLPIPFSINVGAYDTIGAVPTVAINVNVETTVNNGQSGGAKPITYAPNFPSSTTNGAIVVAT